MSRMKPKAKEGGHGTDVVILQNIPSHYGLVKANRFLLLLASVLIGIVFLLSFLLLPDDNIMQKYSETHRIAQQPASQIQNSVISAEINALKGQLVGLVSGSIESKLRSLEESVRAGSLSASLGTIQDLKNDVSVLRAYSKPADRVTDNQSNAELLKEVSQLKNLIYFILSSCGLMLAAIAGFWAKSRFHFLQYKHTRSLGANRE